MTENDDDVVSTKFQEKEGSVFALHDSTERSGLGMV